MEAEIGIALLFQVIAVNSVRACMERVLGQLCVKGLAAKPSAMAASILENGRLVAFIDRLSLVNRHALGITNGIVHRVPLSRWQRLYCSGTFSFLDQSLSRIVLPQHSQIVLILRFVVLGPLFQRGPRGRVSPLQQLVAKVLEAVVKHSSLPGDDAVVSLRPETEYRASVLGQGRHGLRDRSLWLWTKGLP